MFKGLIVPKALGLASVFIVMAPQVISQPNQHGSARLLYKYVTGVSPESSNPILETMEESLRQGDVAAAARLATQEDQFINTAVRQFASRIETLDMFSDSELTDFQAMILGVVRDNGDARSLLTGNFNYQFDPAQALPAYSRTDNEHFKSADLLHKNFARHLVRQALPPPTTEYDESAGLLTSRKFSEKAYDAGTNRRAVDFSMAMFLCSPIASLKDTGLSERRIGRDVDRNPGGDAGRYQTECRSCHAILDSARGAFAYLDFYQGSLQVYAGGQPGQKYSQNAHVYRNGFVTRDASWINQATQNHNQNLGWRGPVSGYGVNAYGKMLGDAVGFSRCMASRVYRQLCRSAPTNTNQDLINSLASSFESNHYSLRELFVQTAAQSQCWQ